MKNGDFRIFSKLFLQLSAIFLLVLIVFASFALFISIHAARSYSLEVNQKLNWDLARNTVSMINPDFSNGTVNNAAVQDIVHSMMVINPSVEVYILNPEGDILAYVAPEKVVKLEKVSLKPIHKFLNATGKRVIVGDDPRNPGEKKIFSAAQVIENGVLKGYIYIVLASQEYISTAQMVIGSYILGLSIRSVIIILVISALIGLLAIWFITRKLNVIVHGIQRFREGNLKSRIPVKTNDELDKIGMVFNEMAERIEHNIEELKGIDNLRKELISNISHDLRTPVASIQGYSETLLIKQDSLTREEQRKYLNIIYRSCDHLKKQVSDLFELSKLQSNQAKLVPEKFSIAELVNDVANKYRILSQKQGISINTIIDRNVPMVEADISMIDRVLQNLIDNALKFCKEGDYINIEINPLLPDQVEVKIVDSGEGIRQDELPYIFERYYKGDSPKSNSGLGLAIVKKIMDLHKCKIEVNSQRGKGTAFRFTLPVMQMTT